VIVLALTVHEFAHALAADMMGDSTPRRAGRLTLEPWAHLDPVGMIALVFYRFGWAKPVPVNPFNMRKPARGLAISSLAGPIANVLMAMLFSLLLAFGAGRIGGTFVAPHLQRMLTVGIVINAGLAVFNLLPLPPLDGSRILTWLVPVEKLPWWDTLESYGPLLLLLLMVTGAAGVVISPPVSWLANGIYGLALGLARLLGLG
jgi:Zn-dependent protease